VSWNIIADEHLKVVFLAVSGPVTGDDIAQMYSEFKARFGGRGFGAFIHIESATLVVSPEAIQQVADQEPVFKKIAFYAATPPTREVCGAYAVASSSFSKERRVAVFSDTVSAFAWLMDPVSGVLR
jgi:hypothetical protein